MDRFAIMNTFVKVVETGGFSAAARRLDTSPQNVSNHIQALEHSLGVRLLDRTTRKMRLTEVGRSYYGRCAQILADLDEADQIAGALHSTLKGTLRINVTTSLAPLITPVSKEFLARSPDVSIEMTTTDRMVDVIEEEYDLAIRNTHIVDSQLIVRKVASYRFIVCGAPSYLKIHGAPETPRDLVSHNFVIFSAWPIGTEWRFNLPSGQQAIRLKGNFRCNNGHALRVAAIQGLGLLVTPEYTVIDHLKSGRLVPLLTSYPLEEFPVNVVYPHRRLLSAKVRSYIDLLAAQFSRPVWAGSVISDLLVKV